MPKKTPRLSRLSTRERALFGLLIGIVVAAVFASVRNSGPVERFEWRLVDARTQAYVGSRPPDPRIVMAVVDDYDVEMLKKHDVTWPWDLTVNSLAFQWMAAAKVRAVAVDVLHMNQGGGPKENGNDAQEREGQELGGAYAEVGATVLAYELSSNAPQEQVVYDYRLPHFREHVDRMLPVKGRPSFERNHAYLPAYWLLSGAHRVGYVNQDTDTDGVVRRASPFAAWHGKVLQSLPLATAVAATDGDVDLSTERIVLGSVTQRLDPEATFYVNFRSDRGGHERVKVSDLVFAGNELKTNREKNIPGVPSYQTATPDRLRGKIVIWGIDLQGQKDIVPAAVSARMSGPNLQATILDNLLNGDGRTAVPRLANIEILFGLCALLGVIGGITKRRGTFIGAWALFSAGTYFVAFKLFARGTSIDLFTPLVALLVTYAGVVAFRELTEGRRNRWLEGTFGQYLSPAVIGAIKKDPALLELGGRKREVTVLFSDVKGFTSISEKLSSEDLVRLLNHYLTRQSEPILAVDGVIDKFIGDAVVAFFGDPVSVPDHALRACRAAVQCADIVKDSQPLADELGAGPVSNRIGVNSGTVTVGNMGSDKRFDYTCIGDTVNFSSRLEGANKAFGSRILIGPATYEQAKQGIVAIPIAKLQVVGKSETVAVHALLGLRGETPQDVLIHADAYEKAHAWVLRDNLEAAKAALAEAEAAKPDDGPTAWLRGLVGELESGKRPRPWDGIFVLDAK
jgi:adenylate cyclase